MHISSHAPQSCHRQSAICQAFRTLLPFPEACRNEKPGSVQFKWRTQWRALCFCQRLVPIYCSHENDVLLWEASCLHNCHGLGTQVVRLATRHLKITVTKSFLIDANIDANRGTQDFGAHYYFILFHKPKHLLIPGQSAAKRFHSFPQPFERMASQKLSVSWSHLSSSEKTFSDHF